eukprot:UN08098
MHYTTITIISTIVWIHIAEGCQMAGYTIWSTSDDSCKTLDIICSTGNGRWDIKGCGCGCKPDCVRLGDTYIGNFETCKTARVSCQGAREFWSDEKCGCGCTSGKVEESGSDEEEEEDINYFGFINFDMNRFAIYEFVLMIFILMAFVLNVTFFGYCCVIRFKDLDYSFVRNINRNNKHTKIASECSD